MIRTVAVFVFVSFACVATAFSQTIEKENKIDVQKKNSSAEVSGHQLPEAKNIEPKLPDIEAKKLATDDKSMQTYGLTPSSPASGLSPYFYDFPALLESNPTLTAFLYWECRTKDLSGIGEICSGKCRNALDSFSKIFR